MKHVEYPHVHLISFLKSNLRWKNCFVDWDDSVHISARLKHKPQLVIFNLISQPYLVSHSKGWRITFGKGGWVCHSTVNV